jgi:hypothetical protein
MQVTPQCSASIRQSSHSGPPYKGKKEKISMLCKLCHNAARAYVKVLSQFPLQSKKERKKTQRFASYASTQREHTSKFSLRSTLQKYTKNNQSRGSMQQFLQNVKVLTQVPPRWALWSRVDTTPATL